MMQRFIGFVALIFFSISLPLFAAEIDYMTPLNGPENKMVNSNFFKYKANKWLKDNKNKRVSVIMGREPCPTNWWGYWGNANVKTKWQRDIKKVLKGFPQNTVNFCTEVAYVVRDGQVTSHPVAVHSVSRGPGSLYVQNKSTKEIAAITVIQENDYRESKTGGRVFNENLDQICEFKFTGKSDDVIIKCVGVGSLAAKVEVLSVFNGTFRVFGENEAFKVLVSNLSLKDLLAKYPSLSPKVKSKCSYNCN